MELVDVIARICTESDLPPAPLEGWRIWSFRAGLDADEQPSSSYRLPIGDVSADILADVDYHVSSITTGMHFKKVSKVTPLSLVFVVGSTTALKGS